MSLLPKEEEVKISAAAALVVALAFAQPVLAGSAPTCNVPSPVAVNTNFVATLSNVNPTRPYAATATFADGETAILDGSVLIGKDPHQKEFLGKALAVGDATVTVTLNSKTVATCAFVVQ